MQGHPESQRLKIRRPERAVGAQVPLPAPDNNDPYNNDPSLRSGFRLRAQTPAKRLNLKSAGPKGLWGFKSPSRHQTTTILITTILRCAQDFACGLRRPQNGST